MPIPSAHYIKLVGGATSTISDLYTSGKIKVGDTLHISGTASNNGVYLVHNIVSNLNTGSGLGGTFTDAVRGVDITSGDQIIMNGAEPRLTVGLSVSGTNIKPGTYITSVTQTTSPATFVISDDILGTVSAGATLTFADRDIYFVLKGRSLVDETSAGSTDPTIKVVRATSDKMCAIAHRGSASAGVQDNTGGVSVWSSNAATAYGSGQDDNGWTANAINPTLDGFPSKVIFHFVDEVLRACDINTENTSQVKWFGYIQRDQFNDNLGLAFAEWQEHPNNLRSPETDGSGISISFVHTTHAIDTAGAYYNEPSNKSRGVGRKLRNASDTALYLNHNPTTSTTAFTFDDNAGSPTVSLDQAYAGELITIGTDYGTVPTEVLLCTKPSYKASSITYSRSYGGNLAGTAPTDYADNATPIIRRGVGWNIGVSEGSADGDWEELTYEFYQSFVYDGNQESIPVVMGDGAASNAIKTHDQPAGKAMRVSVYADFAYNGRISGGRIYIREHGTDNDLSLLVDIDIVKGVRTTFDGDHVPWVPNDATATKGFSALGETEGNSFSMNLDTYTSINGFSPDVRFVAIGGAGEMYKTSVVENRRTFVANVRTLGFTGELEVFGDRIMYSEINKFDTFLPHNFIDVSKGDFGVYTAIESYADRLIAFKHNLVHIINISSPSPANWYLEDTVKNSGVNFHFSVAKTKYGVAWVSEDGCYLYDGNKTMNLLNNKISVSQSSFTGINKTWNDWYRGSANVKDVMLGYDPISNSLLMIRSPNDSTDDSHSGWLFDFDSAGWVFHSQIFTNNYLYSNFVTDWNNNLVVAENTSSSDSVADIKKFLPIKTASADMNLFTKDIDFGEPGLIKKIYKVTMTYKCSAEQQTPLYYAIDGTQSFSAFATGTGITPQGNTGGAGYLESTASSGETWDVAVFTPSSPISCQSIQFELDPPTSATMEINDMTIEYRIIRNKNVS